ncbi:unnamed protein product [Acanthosepion pharaonis]|uniref:Uncharacterized protein n=1 Tax=Acanthosepion pharaonis TaxID=158019 RepID=A0A812EE16_ACAPH|nr:unnamed protein product [Sepia pharaonis]
MGVVLGTLAGRLVHPTAQVLHIKSGPLGTRICFCQLLRRDDGGREVGRLRIRESRPVPPVPSARVGRGRERPRVLQSKLRREPATRQVDWSFAPTPDSDDRFARQRHFGLPPVSCGFIQTGRDSPSFGSLAARYARVSRVVLGEKITDPGVIRPRAAPKLDDLNLFPPPQAPEPPASSPGDGKIVEEPIRDERRKRGKRTTGRRQQAPAESGMASQVEGSEKLPSGTAFAATGALPRVTGALPRALSLLLRLRGSSGSLRLANGQDSSVRVSRRVGWVADAPRGPELTGGTVRRRPTAPAVPSRAPRFLRPDAEKTSRRDDITHRRGNRRGPVSFEAPANTVPRAPETVGSRGRGTRGADRPTRRNWFATCIGSHFRFLGPRQKGAVRV